MARIVMAIALLISMYSSAVRVDAQATNQPAIAPSPRLTLTAEQEYTIREILFKEANVPKEDSAPETIGDPVPDNVKLYPLSSEIVKKVPQVRSHEFFIKDDKVVLVSPSDRRIADVIQKKATD